MLVWSFDIKVLELLEILQFQLPESHSEFPPELHALKDELKVCVSKSIFCVILVIRKSSMILFNLKPDVQL